MKIKQTKIPDLPADEHLDLQQNLGDMSNQFLHAARPASRPPLAAFSTRSASLAAAQKLQPNARTD